MSNRRLYIEPCAFSGFPLDPADHLRGDEAWIKARKQDPTSLYLLFHDLRPLMDVSRPEGLMPGFLEVKDVPKAALDAAVFLGLMGEMAIFAVDVTGEVKKEEAESKAAKFIDVRSVALQMIAQNYSPVPALLGKAKSLLDWHARHRFCANCGAPTRMVQAGYVRRCPACAAQHFPRTDPVVIMLVYREDKMLVGRSPGWPEGNFSALAGFVEPGETLEDACRREVLEEVGIRVGKVEYVKSQPWPFPSSLMVGLFAEAQSEDIILNSGELEQAIWVSRDQARHLLITGGTDKLRLVPYPIAIARHLIEKWVEEGR
ncbi:NAD(+) diphosphatase [Luteithermobacter gelatinilyticus]|uniref:NAD(+) diphosphatase n=1 Tax=Luteithermobacter gelatinilyticus TaxID=2582913 RepID=UPI0011058E1E|nr:NAD(+) diphosphatase [Luteithermobacter gelatinilyticus]|tara:strand:+ start:1214 stop:2161 length:948 start_codon:yes stop_codon:yes gene_type:complete